MSTQSSKDLADILAPPPAEDLATAALGRLRRLFADAPHLRQGAASYVAGLGDITWGDLAAIADELRPHGPRCACAGCKEARPRQLPADRARIVALGEMLHAEGRSRFVKITRDGVLHYVNLDRVEFIRDESSERTAARAMLQFADRCMLVEESPEQILGLDREGD